jgi:uncharacterized membrane protein SirB2
VKTISQTKQFPTMQNVYNAVLVAHIIGLTMVAGTTLVDYITTRYFWKQYAIDKRNGIAIQQAISKFQFLPGIGLFLLIISGVGMMALTRGVFGEQIWFRIKFGIVIVIIVNSLAVGRRQGSKLKRLLLTENSGRNPDAELLKIKRNLRWFHIIQITLFIIVFVLSAFKFN